MDFEEEDPLFGNGGEEGGGPLKKGGGSVGVAPGGGIEEDFFVGRELGEDLLARRGSVVKGLVALK